MNQLQISKTEKIIHKFESVPSVDNYIGIVKSIDTKIACSTNRFTNVKFLSKRLSKRSLNTLSTIKTKISFESKYFIENSFKNTFNQQVDISDGVDDLEYKRIKILVEESRNLMVLIDEKLLNSEHFEKLVNYVSFFDPKSINFTAALKAFTLIGLPFLFGYHIAISVIAACLLLYSLINTPHLMKLFKYRSNEEMLRM